MIFDASSLPLPLRLSTDLCVVGSGAGGMTAAAVAAEAGVSTLVVEAGEFLTPRDMSQREDQMFARMLWDNGNRGTADGAVRVLQARGVGGSTLHNQNLIKRIPDAILRHWIADRGLTHLPLDAWAALYSELEGLLSVSEIPPSMRNKHNELLKAGCESLGWKGGPLSHNRTGCVASGFCEVGCRYDAKNNAAKVFLPRAVAAGAEVLTLCQAVRLRTSRGVVRGVEAVALDRATRRPIGRVEIDAKRVCLSGSATATSAILQRSGVPDPSGLTGNNLLIHPAVVVAGEFDHDVRGWMGVPQSWECTELLDLSENGGHGAWILTVFGHPVGTATMVPGLGAAHAQLMHAYPRLGAFTAVIHDRTPGRVRPDGDTGLSIEYWPDDADRAELALGLWGCAKLLFAAGARRIHVPARRLITVERGESLDFLKSLPIRRAELDLSAVHPMSTVPMGDDPARAPVDSRGRHHHIEGLWVADGSLFPTSIGVPPQLSIYAMGLHVGRAIAAA